MNIKGNRSATGEAAWYHGRSHCRLFAWHFYFFLDLASEVRFQMLPMTLLTYFPTSFTPDTFSCQLPNSSGYTIVHCFLLRNIKTQISKTLFRLLHDFLPKFYKKFNNIQGIPFEKTRILLTLFCLHLCVIKIQCILVKIAYIHT